ncbi:hypothetical protein D4R75_02530 [bacterium]|nr:MAG: hypothetical protein D4R75_02530 [bacterium]
MKSFIQDLFGHQEWADAELWKAVEACPGALDQEDISKRFRHFHSTQYAYLQLLRGEKADVRSFISRFGDSVPIQTVKQNAIETHRELAKFLADLPESKLEEKLFIPWFKDPTFIVTTTQALVQVAMHSQYHRGQNATRLREVGGTPPTLDFVLWIWKGRPKAEWSSGNDQSIDVREQI